MKPEDYNLFSAWVGAITLGLWVVTLAAGVGTVVIYYKQLKSMEASSKEQNLAWLIQYLQSTDVREAREFVLWDLKLRPVQDRWRSPVDKKKAATACAAYGVAGVYIKTKRIDPDLIIDNWGPSIKEVCEVCKPVIEERRRENGPKYWEALLEINELAKKAHIPPPDAKKGKRS